MAFRLAHLSDPHLNPLPRPTLRELMGKRATGYANWLRSRRRVHDMALMARIVADLRNSAPDHVACTGDLTHVGLPSEFERAVSFLDGLGPREKVSFVPGNHDAYVAGSLAALGSTTQPWRRSDEGADGYPWLKVRGHVALVGLSSAVPTGPLMAWGRVGAEQMEKAEMLLHYAARRGLRRVVLIHHPPHVGGAKAGRELKDAAGFEAMLGRTGADLVVHGHNHRTLLAWLATPQGRAPVVGVPSCSMQPSHHAEGAAWHLFTIPEEGAITLERRGLMPDGSVGRLAEVALGGG